MDTAIAGTTSLPRLRDNARPLPADVLAAVDAAIARAGGPRWPGVI